MSLTVIIPGTFDLKHSGHEELIDYCLALHPKEVACLVNGDKMLDGRKEPVDSQETRAQKIREYLDNNYDGISMVYIADTINEWKETILSYAPCVVVHGNDWTCHGLSRLYGVEENWWKDNNIYLLYKDRKPGISTTMLKEEMSK